MCWQQIEYVIPISNKNSHWVSFEKPLFVFSLKSWFWSDSGVAKTELRLMKCLKMVICWIQSCGSSHNATLCVFISRLYIVGSVWKTSEPSPFSTLSVTMCHVISGLHYLLWHGVTIPVPPPPPPPQIVMKPPWSLLTDSGTTQRPLLLVTRRFRWNLA